MNCRDEIKIDQEKYKHNEDYRKIIQNRFKDDLVQPFDKHNQKNPEFIKRYGTEFYKRKSIQKNEEPVQTDKNKKTRIILGHSKWSKVI